MKSRSILFSFVSVLLMLLSACSSEAQNNSTPEKSDTAETQIEVIQFHSEHRCMTCNKIETLSREVLEMYPNIPFSLVNVDDEKNEAKAEAFEAYGTALFLYNTATGDKKNLTEFAFMNAGNEEKFIEGLNKEITLFQKQ